MSRGAYVGVGNLAKRVKGIYVGVDGRARRVKKGYIGVNGVARLFYSSETSVVYTGEYTVSEITVDGAVHKLYTLLTSGTLTLDGDARYWMCGGGAGGESASSYNCGRGGGGGYVREGTINAGSYAVTIAAGGAVNANGGATKIGSALTANGGNKTGDGGSGGGAAYVDGINTVAGKGAGVSTIPFGLEMDPHCAGGGGGQLHTNGYTNGGNGGSNGSDGYSGGGSGHNHQLGGERGGGNGGNPHSPSVSDPAGIRDGSGASFYGSAGGGGGLMVIVDSNARYYGTGGAGYQGVAYVLV